MITFNVTGDMNNIETAIQYGLTKISDFVDQQLQIDDDKLEESLELVIIKHIIKNFKKNAEQDDYIDFLDNVFDYIDHEYSLIDQIHKEE